MGDIKQFTQRLKFVKGSDLAAIPAMCIGFFASVPFRMAHRNIWLVCERKNEARDNGYWFYKYLCENHSEIESVYAINKNGLDYAKVEKLGKVIQFGSIVHWMYYFAARWNISSQKEGKPNAALCYLLEVYLGARKNRIYLKHGIMKDAQRWIYNDVSRIQLLCCAAKREQQFIIEKFGYPAHRVVLTGLARFDNLLSEHETKRQVVVMPTMREWLRSMSSDTVRYEGVADFRKSEYFITWSSLLKSEKLHNILKKYDIRLLFYPHPAMQKYLNDFEIICDDIELASAQKYDMQRLLMESAVLITDYSSVFFDFAYMKKPVIYYQFDYEKYRRGQYQEGYFSYERDGFGPIAKTEEDLLFQLTRCLENGFLLEKKYADRADKFYVFHDTENCRRIYDAIISLGKPHG